MITVVALILAILAVVCLRLAWWFHHLPPAADVAWMIPPRASIPPLEVPPLEPDFDLWEEGMAA